MVWDGIVDVPRGEFWMDLLRPGSYALVRMMRAPSEDGMPDRPPVPRALDEVEIRAGEVTRFEASLR
jgi:hypothetical protein